MVNDEYVAGAELKTKPQPRARNARELRAKPEPRAQPEIEGIGKGIGEPLPRQLLKMFT